MGDSAYHKYIKSAEWGEIKLDLIQTRGNHCQDCGKDVPPQHLQVHHLTYERLFNELPQDLVLLCTLCHMKQHESKIPKHVIKAQIAKEKRIEKWKKWKEKGSPNKKSIVQVDEITPSGLLIVEARRRLIEAGYVILREKKIKYGYQFRLSCKTKVRLWQTGRVTVTGPTVSVITEIGEQIKLSA